MRKLFSRLLVSLFIVFIQTTSFAAGSPPPPPGGGGSPPCWPPGTCVPIDTWQLLLFGLALLLAWYKLKKSPLFFRNNNL